MKHDIDIFKFYTQDGLTVADNHRWDSDKNAKLLNIVFAGGTFGNFLKYFIDKFSQKTPEIDDEPFTDIGTSHTITKIKFSGMIQRYHSSFIRDNEGEAGLPVCLILPSTEKHFLFLKKAMIFRSDDAKTCPDDLWKKAVGEMPILVREQAQNILKLYDIKEQAHFSWIPKFIVRDWYKLEFLQDIKDTQDYHWFQQFKKHPFFGQQNVFHLDLESFFDWEVFLTNIKKLDQYFGLALDFDRLEQMKILFERGHRLDEIRKECNLVEQVLKNETDDSLTDLDVSTEAFIYAYFEKRYPDIQLPLTNRFFRDYTEIKQFLEHFPNWYRRSNPNIG